MSLKNKKKPSSSKTSKDQLIQPNIIPSSTNSVMDTKLSAELTTTLDTEEARKTENKIKDIKTIDFMIQKVNSIISGNNNINEWQQLAELADKITRFSADKKSIRNIYGDIIKNGICWQDIYHIKAIIIHKPDTFSNIINNVLIDLPLLKSKLQFILKEQLGFIADNFEDNEVSELNTLACNAPTTIGEKLQNIEKSISKEYCLLIIEKIKTEINIDDQDFIFNNRENKYFLARKFTIIGELVNQLKVSGEYSELVTSLDDIITIRDSLVHNHRKLLNIDSIKENTIAESIKKLFEAIKVAINANNFGNTGIKQLVTEVFTHIDSSTLYTQGAATQNTATNVPKKKKEQSEETLDKFIAKIVNTIERKVGNIDKLNQDYINRISELPQEQQSIFPNNILTEQNQKQIQDINLGIKQKIQEQLSASKKMQEAENLAKKKREYITSLEQIEDEYKFLINVETSTVSPVKKAYIYEHAVNVIGELMEKIRNEKQQEISKEVSSVASNTFKTAQSTSNYLRKNGLSHDIFSFDDIKFNQLTLEDILPAKDDVRSVTYILSADKSMVSSVRIMKNVASSYIRLGLYSEAIKVLLKAKQHVETNEEEVNKEKLDSSGIGELYGKMHLLDLDQLTLGVDSYQYEIADMLSIAYTLDGFLAEANKVLQELFNKIDYNEVASSSAKFHNLLSTSLATLAKNFLKDNNIEQAKFLYDQAYKLAKDEQGKYNIKFGLMECYLTEKNDAEASLIEKELSNITDPLLQFSLKITLFSQHIEKKEINGAKQILYDTQNFLQTNKAILKEYIGDRFLLFPLEIIIMKLKIFDSNSDSTKIELTNIEKEFNQCLKLIPVNFLDTPELGRTYISFSTSYLLYARKIGISNALDEFNLAKQYTSKALPLASVASMQGAKNLAIIYSNIGSSDKGYLEKRSLLELEDDLSTMEMAKLIEQTYNIYNEKTIFNYATAISHIAEKHYANKNFDEAYSKYQKTLKIVENLPSAKKESEYYRVMGLCSERLWELTKDIAFLEKAITTYNNFLSSFSIHPDKSEIFFNNVNCQNKLKYHQNPIKLQKIETKVINAFNSMKGSSSSISIEGVSENDLKEYCQYRLDKDDIKIGALGKRVLISIDETIAYTLKTIISITKAPTIKSGLLCIDALMDDAYVKYNEEEFKKFGNALVAIGEESYKSYTKLLIMEDHTSNSNKLDYSALAFSAQQGLRFFPTISYFLGIFGINLPKIELSIEHKGILDFTLGIIKTKADVFDHPLILGQILESGTYYSIAKTTEMLASKHANEYPKDIASLLKVCLPEISNGLTTGISLMSSSYIVYGLISGTAQCLSKYQLFNDETSTQAHVRITADVAIGLVSAYFTPGNILSRTMSLMNNIVMNDISFKVAYSVSDISLNGIAGEQYINYNEI